MAGKRQHDRAEHSDHVRPGALSALLLEVAAAPECEADDVWSPLHPGTKIGRFELVREVGRGGFGVVWEGWDPELARPVAIKCVRVRRNRSPADARLLDEAEAAARLSHPNLVTLYDAGRAPQGPYLVLELLQGATLAERLRAQRVSLAEALRIATDVARGVAHAHAKGIVHRDLKPENIFLCEDGSAKVLDFGLAHAFGRTRREGGTPGYMAPEQLAGAPEDERTDVFALGVILYEMLLGSRPFADERALASAHEAPALEVPDLPPLGVLVAQMIRKSPVARPRHAGEVLDALAALGPAVPRRPASATIRRRGRRAWIAALAVALLGVAAAAIGVRSRRVAAPPRERAAVAVLPFADMSPEKNEDYLADGLSDEILSTLSRVGGLRVVGRTSSFYFKGRSDPLPVIGARLGANVLVEGSVRRAGERLRVTAQLVSAADGYQLWSETYDRTLDDVFAIQDEIARRVAAALRVERDAASPRDATASHGQAYSELLRARHLASRGTQEDLRQSIAAAEHAIALDPEYAPAYAALCDIISLLPWYSTHPLEQIEPIERELQMAERAIALDPLLPEGYACRAEVNRTMFRWEAARADVETAFRLNNGPVSRLAVGANQRAMILAAYGKIDEAIAEAERGITGDPLDADKQYQLATYYNATGRSARAKEILATALELARPQPHLLRELGFTEILLGRPEEALSVARRNPSTWMRSVVEALAFHTLGRRNESDTALARLEVQPGLAYQVAQVHAWRGETDDALRALERARQQHDAGLMYVKYDPFLRAIRGDTRYRALLRAINLPVD